MPERTEESLLKAKYARYKKYHRQYQELANNDAGRLSEVDAEWNEKLQEIVDRMIELHDAGSNEATRFLLRNSLIEA